MSALQIRIEHRLSPAFALEIDETIEGPAVALFGPSGSGKTSILTAIAGLWTPSSARIAIGDVVVLDTGAGVCVPPQRRRVGYVPQDALLFPLRSVRENLAFGRPDDAPLSLDAVADALEISHLLDRRPRQLSGGERQRVALGRAVLSAPSMLACDEPFSALDARRRDRLVRVLLDWRAELRIPMVLVSHQLDEIRGVDQVAVMADGSLRTLTTPDAL